jgi:hypothetical protein
MVRCGGIILGTRWIYLGCWRRRNLRKAEAATLMKMQLAEHLYGEYD